MLDSLDAAAIRRWCGGGLASLRAHQHEIDQLNVYPVPDGDTGTNLVLTLTSAQQALDQPADLPGEAEAAGQTPLGAAMRRMARGALLGARGNSGVIVSQILRGMADAFATSVAVRGGELARALRRASEAAYAAVAKPVEGTVLSVVAAAADGAGRISSDDLVAVARAAARAAAEALARTPQQLPILARAGVVDAGGRGLVLLLEALVDALSNTGPRPAAAVAGPGPAEALVPPAGGSPAVWEGFGYEVQYLLDAEPDAVDVLRGALDGLGDSLVVVGTGEGKPPTWNVHIHVDDIGAAVEAGIVAGRPHKISVTRLVDRLHPHGGAGHVEPCTAAGAVTDPGARAAVVVAAGDGLTSLFAAEGAVVVGRNPSIAEMLAAITATGAGRVVLLPNDANTHAVASAAAREAAATGLRVSVVPTRSPVQALAALAVRDAQRPFDDDVIAMAEAAGACRYGEVCTASREALTVAGRCRPGDLLGLVDGEVHVIGADLEEVCRRLLDRMLGGGGELATLVLGADAPGGLEERLRGHLAHEWPFVELHFYAGGQPRYHLLVGVE
ncbi:DAK2 domain-containing protein [Amorphoplanes digitatis]|uniref:DAK2 domain fusion protein YloV n=1 Tax=Actinoplanes digitatis TaxID=1868 RepID=A0A7W7HT44_9ACTN|nr:DAK2 domain-containing protein [Actinoplanes digitatis]MBB4760318.1 DAK2 domain fusion protein YloV [Actinoplanes digitatis]GID97499.1 dihydroxyacetone kinase [Actinoplanes digitatis]